MEQWLINLLIALAGVVTGSFVSVIIEVIKNRMHKKSVKEFLEEELSFIQKSAEEATKILF